MAVICSCAETVFSYSWDFAAFNCLTFEKDFLLFLKNSKEPQTIGNILETVWGYSEGIETHTVETHVHRLRKKFLDSFNDNNFIKNNKKGYYI